MERAAVPLFGVRAYGVHLNGFVGEGEDLRLWVARRSASKQTAPGKLDHIVAGGQPMGLGLMENLIKECAEEAAMAESLARTGPAGRLRQLCDRTARGPAQRHLLCLRYRCRRISRRATPTARSNGSSSGRSARCKARLASSDDFKFNVALVNIDFLVRRGYLGARRARLCRDRRGPEAGEH